MRILGLFESRDYWMMAQNRKIFTILNSELINHSKFEILQNANHKLIMKLTQRILIDQALRFEEAHFLLQLQLSWTQLCKEKHFYHQCDFRICVIESKHISEREGHCHREIQTFTFGSEMVKILLLS